MTSPTLRSQLPLTSPHCATFKLGLDVDLDVVVVATQCDNSAIFALCSCVAESSFWKTMQCAQFGVSLMR